jgi:hypothetical protein
MTVENRNYPRIRLSLSVDLVRRGRRIGSAVTEDLSLGGLALQQCTPDLKQNDIVLLRVWLHGEMQTLRGFVIYTSESKSGIMLIGMSRDATRAYFNFLRDMNIPLRMVLDKSVS